MRAMSSRRARARVFKRLEVKYARKGTTTTSVPAYVNLINSRRSNGRVKVKFMRVKLKQAIISSFRVTCRRKKCVLYFDGGGGRVCIINANEGILPYQDTTHDSVLINIKAASTGAHNEGLLIRPRSISVQRRASTVQDS